MLRKKTAGVHSDGRQLLAVRFDRLEPDNYFAFHASGQAMYGKTAVAPRTEASRPSTSPRSSGSSRWWTR
jgi:hypothetical protein